MRRNPGGRDLLGELCRICAVASTGLAATETWQKTRQALRALIQLQFSEYLLPLLLELDGLEIYCMPEGKRIYEPPNELMFKTCLVNSARDYWRP